MDHLGTLNPNGNPNFMASNLILRAADQNEVPATHVTHGSDRLVILSHGITSNKDEGGIYTRFVDEFLSPGFDSIRFDFRGHGDSRMSSRDVTIAGEILDFMAVLQWARAQKKYRQLYHVTASFGCSITLLCAARFDLGCFARVAFWNPVVDYDHTFIHSTVPWGKTFFNQARTDELACREGTPIPQTSFTIGPRMTMEMLHLRPQETIWPKAVPLLVLHGDQDHLVPHADAMDYCKRNKGVAFRTIAGADHGFGAQIATVYEATRSWLLAPS